MAQIVKEVFQKDAAGETIKGLVDLLNERSVKTTRGGKMKIGAVKNMLKNRRYIGAYRYWDIV